MGDPLHDLADLALSAGLANDQSVLTPIASTFSAASTRAARGYVVFVRRGSTSPLESVRS